MAEDETLSEADFERELQAMRREEDELRAALEAAAARMADRSDGAYESNPTATLATWCRFRRHCLQIAPVACGVA